MKSVKYGKLKVMIHSTREEMGKHAAQDAALCIKTCLQGKETINCMFAAAPSQLDFISSLKQDKTIEWQRINAYQMDEYVGIKQYAPQSFSGFLYGNLFSQIPLKTINCLDGSNNPEEEAKKYALLIKENPIDIVFMGIGENGHIAFNDPSVADFFDKELVKVVELESSCRQQQVNDRCFFSLEEVPKYAMTVTIPGLMRAKYHFCIVPGLLKAQAVKKTLEGEVSEKCPASILRIKENSRLYIDAEASGLLNS